MNDTYLLKGPATYIPRQDEEVVEKITARINLAHNALVIKALRDTTDISGVKRTAGQRWLHRIEGQYIQSPDEEIQSVRKGFVLTDIKALHIKAVKNFKDFYGVQRKAGDEWLITKDNTDNHIQDIHE